MVMVPPRQPPPEGSVSRSTNAEVGRTSDPHFSLLTLFFDLYEKYLICNVVKKELKLLTW